MKKTVDGLNPSTCPYCGEEACAAQTMAPVRIPLQRWDNGAHVLHCDELCVMAEFKRHVVRALSPPELYLICEKGHGWLAQVGYWDA